jgi:hypothetical protein
MYDSDNRKNTRREKIVSKNFKKNKISEEEKFLSKVKKEKKQKIEHIREEELWEDWEEFS